MKINTIEFRILQAALLPAVLVALGLNGVFFFNALYDIERDHSQIENMLLQQVVAASEHGLLTGDSDHLQAVAHSALHEPMMRSVRIVDTRGRLLASAGQATTAIPNFPKDHMVENRDRATGLKLLAQTVRFDGIREPAGPAKSQMLGQVLIELSQESVLQHRRDALWMSLWMTLGGLLFGAVLGLRLTRRVRPPITRVSRMIERISRGELSARSALHDDDPLHGVQLGLNQMAERLQSHRDELELRIHQATLNLHDKIEEAQLATQAKTRFLAAASHDLRQPTHALGMFVARLAQLQHNTEARHLIGSLERSVQALQDMLDGLLDLSRLETGVVQAQIRAFSLNMIFDQLRVDFSLVAAEKSLRLRIKASDALVLSDPALLQRILLNLLDNALRYTLHGWVLLACRRTADGKQVRIEIRDTGIGIAPEHHAAIFNEFYQVNNVARDRSKGMGLGLNIVARATQLLGLRLQMRSRPGQGTCFSLELPLAPPDVVPERRVAVRESTVDYLTHRHVLVVEDDALAREALVTLLQSWGALVLPAEDMASALASLQHGVVPDVIVSDYRLPGAGDGMAVIARVRAQAGVTIPACLISGEIDSALMQCAKDAGLALLHKPVRPAKLRSLLRHLLAEIQVGRTGGLT